MPLLELRALTKKFGGLFAVSEVDLDVNEGQIRGLIGPNGAGKSTLFNAVTGFFKPTSGKVSFNGEDITGLRSDQVATRGLARTFQSTILFGRLTVMENLLAGVHLQTNIGLFGGLFNPPTSRGRASRSLQRANELVDFVGLGDLRSVEAASLPHGHQRILGVAVALATEPKMLMLDEPVTGMNAEETDQMMGTVRNIRSDLGVTVLLVEHDMRAVMGLCDYITVMDFGRKIAEGTPEEIRENPAVIEAYLGAEEQE
jgi:branched-chain amino acid transport system ATP-binding protein